MSKRIVMAVTNDLLTDQRVDRSCRALREAGYEVTLIGRKLGHTPVFDHPSEEGTKKALLLRASLVWRSGRDSNSRPHA